jgi:hypothetical protein
MAPSFAERGRRSAAAAAVRQAPRTLVATEFRKIGKGIDTTRRRGPLRLAAGARPLGGAYPAPAPGRGAEPSRTSLPQFCPSIWGSSCSILDTTAPRARRGGAETRRSPWKIWRTRDDSNVRPLPSESGGLVAKARARRPEDQINLGALVLLGLSLCSASSRMTGAASDRLRI